MARKAILSGWAIVWFGCGAHEPAAGVESKATDSVACPLTWTVQTVQAVAGIILDWSRLTVDIVGDPVDPAEIDTAHVGVGKSSCGVTRATELGDAFCAGAGGCSSDEWVTLFLGERPVEFDASGWSGLPALIDLRGGFPGGVRAVALVDFTTEPTAATQVVFDGTSMQFNGSLEELDAFLSAERR